MKQAQIVKILAAEFGTTDVNELNKLFRQKESPKTKYRLSGDNLGHIGVTGLIKMITADGIKVTGETRTTLVRFEDIEGLAKAKPRSERPVHSTPKKKVAPAKKATAGNKTALEEALEDDDEDDGDYIDLLPEITVAPKKKRRPARPIGKSGSKFIPKEKK